ncbi:Hypothetical protein CAP_8075 [Chondromyces apiculatus DSM 436]|uniref:Uncharacterized protein n=2 Tax=Chondromyces apiculatus TaxID=51 RepID=A0A017SX32_9BACT|nr:Hypothetical protein CAP_8075 [Chondromyces apiculatus DSM 436]
MALVATLGLGLGAPGCGAAGPAPDAKVHLTHCDPADLAGCERALAAAHTEGRSTPDLLSGYLTARAARDRDDPWVRLHRALTSAAPTEATPKRSASQGGAPQGGAAVIIDGPAPAGLKRPSAASIAWLDTPKLPAPEAIDADVLLLALGGAAGRDLLVHVRGQEVHQLFPRDPLAPFLAGLRPVAKGEASLAHLQSDAAIAAHLRRAFDAAGAFRYVEAARAADDLTAAIASRDPLSEPVLRGRYALHLFAHAGVSLESTAQTPAPNPPEPEPTPTDTAYGDLLRVQLAQDGYAAWRARSASILRGIPADRRDALTNLLAQPRGCAEPLVPPMEDARDLVFAWRLAGALAPLSATGKASANAKETSPPGKLPIKAWLPRYEAMVRATESARTMWSHAPSLLTQRGDSQGLSLSGTPLYRRVTELGLAHIAALKTLAAAEPTRFRALSQITLAYAPGVFRDDPLHEAVVDLSRTSMQRSLAAATSAREVWSSLFTGLVAGTSYPPAVQGPHYLALQGAFTAKLRGDLLQQTGWEVAGLYAADAVYRLFTDQGLDLSFSSEQLARTLTDASALPYPGLGQLATSLGRYIALGVEKKLDPDLTDVARFPAERRKAREALRRALAGLADEPAPAGLLEDLTTLADGLIAVASTRLAHKPAATPDTCTADEDGASPAVRRALAKLGDVRRRIFLAPRYKEGDGAWVVRARMLVTVLSDGMDLMTPAPRGGAGILGQKNGPTARFTLPRAEAEAAIEAGMKGWEERDLADALSSAYTLTRRLFEAQSAEQFTQENGGRMRQTLTAVYRIFRDDTADASAGVALLDALAALPSEGRAVDLRELLLGYARAFAAQGKKDQADFWLLSTLFSSALTNRPFEPALQQAEQSGSRTAWTLRYLAEVSKSKTGQSPDPAAYAAGMRAATDDTCTRADPEPLLSVMAAARDFARGRKTEARAALEQVLTQAEAQGLPVPMMTYRYEEKTTTRLFTLNFNISYGGGVLQSPSSFQLGLGVRTPAEPSGAMIVALAPDGGDGGTDATARYYIQVASLAAAYHYLDGDRDQGARAARRAINALTFGLRLGQSTLSRQDLTTWGKDALATLAVDAQLAAEAGQPLLAGDLWTVVRSLLPQDASDDAITEILTTPAFGLSPVAGIEPLLARTRRSLDTLADPLPCTRKKVEFGAYEEPTCDAYPLALSLRAADALKKLPHLHRAGSAGRCGTLHKLDTFLTSAEGGTYDPDAFTQAVEALRADGLLYDAAVLLTRQRQEGHCNPVLISAARAFGRAPALGPSLRADALSVAVNCTSASLNDAAVDDLLTLHAETRLLPDLNRNLRIVLTIADLAMQTKRWDLLTRLTAEPDFVEQWMRVSPQAATIALLLTQVAATVALQGTTAPASTASTASYDLLCQTFPPGDRAALCADIAALRTVPGRPPSGLAPEQRHRRAEDALRRLLDQTSGKNP